MNDGIVLDTSGNVGIGTLSPASAVGFTPCLEIRGEPSLRFEESGTNKGYEWCMNSSNDYIPVWCRGYIINLCKTSTYSRTILE